MKRPSLGMAPIKTEVSVEAYREIMRLEKTIERLREALRVIADGDVPRQHAVIWRRDGELSKHDKCPHYQVMYEGCEECVSSFARAALEEKK